VLVLFEACITLERHAATLETANGPPNVWNSPSQNGVACGPQLLNNRHPKHRAASVKDKRKSILSD
jgi:hypothetical protein